MKTRLLTSLIFIFVLALAFILKVYVSNYFFDALILFIACYSAYETSKIFSKMGRYNNKIIATIFPIFLMIIALIGIAYDYTIGVLFTVVMEVGVIVLFFSVTFLTNLIDKKTNIELKTRQMDKQYSKSKYSLLKALNTSVIFIYPSFLILFLSFINHFEELTTSFPVMGEFNGMLSLFILLFAFLIPIFTDTFAYITGGLIGGKKLAPKISPKKTISGAIGGFLWCILLSVAVYFIFTSIPSISVVLTDAGITVWKLIIIVAIGSIISQAGDLFESYLKRSADVKDSGNILPGHGGMLDRFDSYMFLVPFLFIAFSILFAVL